MNDLMSLGIHRLWKDHFVGSILPLASSSSSSYNILDVAGGTGDIAFRLLNHTRKVNLSLKTKVTVADINADMLSEGQKRATALEYGTEELNFLQANAETLEGVKDSSIDLYTVAFGIRNFADLDKSLRTAFRVLKPGGTFACLEFSHVGNPAFNALYKRWSFGAIPLIGQLVAGDRASYQYLVESIDRFPSQAEFAERIAKTGFLLSRGRGWEDLTGGVAAIHRGIKPLEEDV
ncbi:MAG: 2-hexaprenyl-6-methoxy-1,4-benzoquinone methyltransferase [Vezdaea acicularis]|nr:MAG: 2-hexaprenyl-6-methoxy-1,4-benzoquinone methyltransferase [Vezdaea acicularis]